MLFTLVIWVFSALSLIAAVILYLSFLWHYIPKQDGRLSIYCKRKIDRRLSKMIGAKVKQALMDQEKTRERREAKASKLNGNLPGRPAPPRQPTLPQIAGTTPRLGDGKLPELKLVRQDSEATLPAYSSQPPSIRSGGPAPYRQPTLARQPTLPDVQAPSVRPGILPRSGTGASNISQSSNAPLLSNATGMGYTEDPSDYPAHPRPVLDRQTSSSYGRRPAPDRQASSSSYGSRPPPGRQMSSSSAGSRPGPGRQTSSSSQNSGAFLARQASASSYSLGTVPERQASASSYQTTSVQDRHMIASPYGRTQVPERQTSASPYDQLPYVDRQPSASPHIGSYLPEQQIPTASYMTRLPPLRALTPLTEVTSQVSSVPKVVSEPSHEQHQYFTPEPEMRQGGYTPVYGSVVRHDTYESTSPIDDTQTQQTTIPSFHRPFSPPVRAATAMTFADSHEPGSDSTAQAFEMISRPPTAPITSTNPSQAPSNGGYVAFNPLYTSTTTPDQIGAPKRSVTSSNYASSMGTASFPQRSATAPPETSTYEDIIDDYGHNREPVRHATAGPSGYEHNPW